MPFGHPSCQTLGRRKCNILVGPSLGARGQRQARCVWRRAVSYASLEAGKRLPAELCKPSRASHTEMPCHGSRSVPRRVATGVVASSRRHLCWLRLPHKATQATAVAVRSWSRLPSFSRLAFGIALARMQPRFGSGRMSKALPPSPRMRPNPSFELTCSGMPALAFISFWAKPVMPPHAAQLKR
jgi:hypothetical protein